MGVLKQNNRLSDIIGTARTVVSQLDLDKAFAIVLRKAMEITKTDGFSGYISFAPGMNRMSTPTDSHFFLSPSASRG